MFLTSLRETVANIIYPEQFIERRDLTRLIDIDPLTGLANRRAFDQALPAAEDDPTIAIVVFDANNFGKLNKRIGHKFGDIVLKEIADKIIQAMKAFKVPARAFRIGGDEFCLLVDVNRAIPVRDMIESTFGVRFPDIQISVSGTIGNTFEAADALLQTRKGKRKNENQS